MKKKDLALDFTSLLDVIMIILFVVVSSMGQASLDAQEQAHAAVAESDAVKENMEALEQDMADMEQELLALRAQNGQADADAADLYELAMKNAKKMTLICNAENAVVTVTVYGGEGEQQALAKTEFVHDFSLSGEARAEANARMRQELKNELLSVLRGANAQLVLFQVEYFYGDKNFSQADLDMIAGAVEDLERELGITCYIDKVKK